jgi:two-component system cell cycle sensor histidine kinase/response regulator CckA
MKTILVLEDDPSNMRVFSALLCSMGYRVLEATTGTEAIAVGNRHQGPLDLLLSDVDVPEPSGTVVALELVKSYPDLKILFVSANPLDALGRNDLENFRQLPPDQVDFLEKPFRLLAFLDKVDEMIRQRGRRSADWPQTEAWPKRSNRSA